MHAREVPRIRTAVFGSVKYAVGLLENRQIVREQAIVFQEPSDEGRQVIESCGGITREGVRHEVLRRRSSGPRC
jgi:hypothetical protein